ncbi:Melanoma-associated antigen B6 [Saguinus oedipus]|uniref:Melanoma-associated antigen B6 n=1 Tax=Saguinus oedipus TaxID=9490 RepID=A0ABQ9TFJ9_SAGOE|nr:Melanoma-associated antigen B6 [Saguinus oedipus]
MPRGQKSKRRARDKRQETHGQPQSLPGPQSIVEKQKETRSSTISSPDYRDAHPKSSDASVPQESQGASSTGSPDTGVSCSKSDVAVKGQDEKNASTSPDASVPQESQGASSAASLDAGISCSKSDVAAKGEDEESTHASQRAMYFKRLGQDPIDKKSWELVQFLQEKFEKNESILKADMLKLVSRRYKEHFPEILKETSEHLMVSFGVELKEIDSSGESYTLVSKLGLPSEGILSGYNGLAKSGILMSALGLIFMKGNRATEEEVWHFLTFLGISSRTTHPLYGNPQKILTEDLVQAKYLEYQQVRNSDPPRYEFLWGPRAHFETSKMRVLSVFAKMNNTVPGFYPNLYEEALIDEVQKALRLKF